MIKNGWYFLVLAAAGAGLFLAGGFALTAERFKTASGWCIGVGAAAFTLGLGKWLDGLLVSKAQSAESCRRAEIEKNDERNIRIREKVGAQINRVVLYALNLMIVAMALMKVSLFILLMPISILLAELVLAIALSNYYARRM